MKKTLCALAILASFYVVASAAESGYHISQRFTLGDATRWDYTAIDTERSRLYVSRGDHVDVVELPSGQPVGTIAATKGVHGMAFAQDLKLGFTSNGKSNSVTVFDLETMKTIAEIKLAGKNPDAILYEPSVHKLYVFNGGSGDVEIIDATTLKIITSVKATGRPEFAVSNGQQVFFNIEDNAGINVIDTATNKIVHQWKLAQCEGPSGLAIDVANNRLFSACQNGFAAVTDARTGKRITQFAIGEDIDAMIYDAQTKTVFASGGGGTGTLSIADQQDADHYLVRPALVTEKSAKTMTINPSDKTIYLPTVKDGKFIVLVATPTQQ